MLWAEQTALATRAPGTALAGCGDAHRTQDLLGNRSLPLISMGLASVDLVRAVGPLMHTHDGGRAGAALEAALGPPVAGAEAVLGAASGNFSGLTTTSGGISAEDTVAAAIAAHRTLIAALAPWGRVTSGGWVWVVALATTVMAAAVVALGEATAVVWATDAECARLRQTRRLAASLGRMHRLLDGLARADGGFAPAALEASLAAPAVERELVPPVRHVLSLVNPCLLDRTVAACTAGGGGGGGGGGGQPPGAAHGGERGGRRRHGPRAAAGLAGDGRPALLRNG